MFRLIDANNMFRKMFAVGLDATQVVTRVPQSGDIWIRDGWDANKYRKDIFPEYKTNRKREGKEYDSIMESLNTAWDLLDYTGVIKIRVPGYEADDVIVNMALDLAKEDKVEVVSTDKDLFYLTQHPNITQNVESKFAPGDSFMSKVLVGDPSDNITGLSGAGEMTVKYWGQMGFLNVLQQQLDFSREEWEKTGVIPKEPPGIFSNQLAQMSFIKASMFNKIINNWDNLVLSYILVGPRVVPMELIGKYTKGTSYDIAKLALLAQKGWEALYDGTINSSK